MAVDPNLHDHGHDHGHDIGADPQVARLLKIVVLVVVAIAAVGLLLWRPTGGLELPGAFEGQGRRVDATVTGDAEVECAGPELGGEPIVCEEVQLDITSGPNAGQIEIP